MKANEGFATPAQTGYLIDIEMKHLAYLATVTATLAFLATGCGRDNVKVYKADASDAPVTPPPAAAPAAWARGRALARWGAAATAPAAPAGTQSFRR